MVLKPAQSPSMPRASRPSLTGRSRATGGLAARSLAVLVALGALALPLPAHAAGSLFDLAGFFDGRSVSAGDVRTLLVSREAFTARFEGRKAGETLRLDERFRFPDGERLQRWTLVFDGPSIRGTVETEGSDGRLHAPVPVEGERSSAQVVLRYSGFAPGGGALKLSFRHEIRPNGDGTLANDVTVRLLGLPLAHSDVTFAKTKADLARHLASEPHP